MVVTGVAASWFAFYNFSANLSLMFCTSFVILAVSFFSRSDSPFFWLPCLASINYMFLSLMPWWTSPSEEIVLGFAALASITAIFVFSKNRTLRAYRKLDNRGGVLLAGIGNSGLGGVYTGLMIALPYFASLLMLSLLGSLGMIQIGIAALITLPIAGGLLGLLLGIGFGFIFDIMIALEFRNRPRNTNRGITM